MLTDDTQPIRQTRVFRDSLAVVATTGLIGVSFGAIATAGGLSLGQTMVLSLVLFSGGSQFALVGVIASGGSPWSAAATAMALGTRNAFYGLRVSTLLQLRGWRKALAAQVVIDESAAMSMGRATTREGRIGFYTAGIGIYVLWNLGTVAGALGASAITDPSAFGLDVAAPAAFIAMLAPRMRGREPWAVALGAAALAVATTPLLPPGFPVLVAGAFGIVVGGWPRRLPARRAVHSRTDQGVDDMSADGEAAP